MTESEKSREKSEEEKIEARKKFLRERFDKHQKMAIRFSQKDWGLGMDILVHHGPVQAWPGKKDIEEKYTTIYTTTRGHIEKILPILEELGIDYELNFNIPDVLTLEQARRLWELDGWENPKQKEVEK